MPLTTTGVAGAVWAKHLSVYPTASKPRAPKPANPNEQFNPAYEYVRLLCEGLVTTTKRLTVIDAAVGSGVGGIAPLAPFLLPAKSAALASFLSGSGWNGPEARKVSDTFVRYALEVVETQGYVSMTTNATVGTGTGVVAPVSNPTLRAQAEKYLITDLTTAFAESNLFPQNGESGAQLNSRILVQIRHYASAYALGLASITASISYVGAPGSATSGVNTGSIV